MGIKTVMTTTFNKTTNTGKTSERKAQTVKDVVKWMNHNHRRYSANERLKAVQDGTIKTKIDFTRSGQNAYLERDEDYRKWFNGLIPKAVIDEYNKKQSCPSRTIKHYDYLRFLETRQKRQGVAEQMILQLGDSEQTQYISQFIPEQEWRKFWVEWAEETTAELERLVPEFKIYDVALHLDESTPHLHILGVGIQETPNAKQGLKVRVSSTSLFTRERLRELHKALREHNQKEVMKLNQLLVKYDVRGEKKGLFGKREPLQFIGQVENKAFYLGDVDNLESAKFLDAVVNGKVSKKDLARIRLLIDDGKPWDREAEFKRVVEAEYTQRLKAVENENQKLKAENRTIKGNVESIIQSRLEAERERVRGEVVKQYETTLKGLKSEIETKDKTIKAQQEQMDGLNQDLNTVEQQRDEAKARVKELTDKYEPRHSNIRKM